MINIKKPVHPFLWILLIICGTIVITGFILWATSSISFTSSKMCYGARVTVNDSTYGRDNIGIIDTNGRGYVIRNYSVIRVGDTYNITYCIYNNTGERIITAISPNAFQCVNVDGVCK